MTVASELPVLLLSCSIYNELCLSDMVELLAVHLVYTMVCDAYRSTTGVGDCCALFQFSSVIFRYRG